MRTVIVASVVVILTIFTVPGSTAAPAASGALASRGSIAMTVEQHSARQQPGATSKYDIAVACALPHGISCGPDAAITLPVPAALRRWTFRASSSTRSLIGKQQRIAPRPADRGTAQLRILLADDVFVGGTRAVITLAMTSAPTATATRWSLRPTLSGKKVGTVTAAKAVTGELDATAANRPAATPHAAPAQSAELTIDPTDQTHAAGTPQSYTINLSCQGTSDARCGPNATVTIPLDTTTTPSMTDGWTYHAVSNPNGLLVGDVQVVANQLVMHVNDAIFVGGFSGGITLQATPPNNVTPNNTSWSLTPTLTGDNIPSVTAPDPAASTATATPQPSISKATSDGGNVYEAGGTIGYTITARCSTASSGNLLLSSGSVVDQLPAGMTFVSATPSTGSYDATTNTVTWSFPDGASTPGGCGDGSTGPNTFRVMVRAPSPAPPSSQQPLTNKATFSGTGPDATNPSGISRSTSAQVPVTIVDQAPTGPGAGYARISKTSLAPIPQPGVSGNQYVATYPGNWLPSATNPEYSVGAAAASFHTTISYGLVGAYQTDVIDPVPCLDRMSGNEYTSAAYNGAPCARPAFHTNVVEVYSPGQDIPGRGVGAAVASGWRPIAILLDGTRVRLAPNGTPSRTAPFAYFAVPAADVDTVAAIEVPPTAALENSTLQLTMWGYADASLGDLHQGVNKLTNVVTAIPQLNGNPLTPISSRASIFTVPPHPQLGVSKSFGDAGGGPNGTTLLTLEGSVNLPAVPLTHDVVLTDLLPRGLAWTNAVGSVSLTLKQGIAAASKSTTADVQDLRDYQGSGRELIRVTIPAAVFTSIGDWKIYLPQQFLELTTPKALGVYPNTDQIFLYNLGVEQILPQCTTPTQTSGGMSTAQFESADPDDLVGDGNDSEQYCQNSASLRILGTGAAFSLVKTVQGDQDTLPKGAGGIGTASHGGSGSYGLQWNNVGSDTLSNAVVYDILPYLGDTGVSRGQANVQRNSRFQPIFNSVGAMPAGVSVQYSQSTNPCRNEVFVNSANTTCVADWTSTEPDPATVRALRFVSSRTYASGDGFAVSIHVDVPPDAVNRVAWNSSATNATDVTNPGNHPLPAEPPKVGLIAPSTATLVTATSAATATAYGQVSDTVTVAGTGNLPGRLEWSLRGPVAAANGSCDGVDWAGAATAASGIIDVSGDGDVTTGPASLQGVGCYSWTDTLTGTDYPYSATSSAGASGEVTQALPFSPALLTTASPSVSGGTESVTDGVTVSGVPAGAPSPGPLTWSLHGPVGALTDGSCPTDATSYAAAAEVDTGTVPVTGNGSYATPTVALPGAGCYSYRESLPGADDSTPAVVDFGDPAETVLVTAPTLTTATSADQVTVFDSISDTLTADGLGTGSGTIAWSLVGPVAPVNGDCANADWTGAATVDSGTVAINNGTFTADVGPVQVSAVGCYSWADTITGDTFPGSLTLPAGTVGEVTQAVASAPSITTLATATVAADGSQQATDRVAVSGLAAGDPGATLTWTLYGPVATDADGNCPATADTYTAVGAADTGTIDVTGNGDYSTSATTLAHAGCYSYGDELPATDTAAAATQAPGDPVETVQASAPTLTTTASESTGTPGDSVTDAVTIAGTNDGSGTLTWSLVGPIAPHNNSCANLDWSSAHAVTSGTQPIAGDAAVTVGPATLGDVGCYSWLEQLTGTFPAGGVSGAGSTNEVILVSNGSGVLGQSGHRSHGNGGSGSGGAGAGGVGSGPNGFGVAGLADTGTDVAVLLRIALAAIVTGAGALLLGRRRRRRATS